MGFLVAACSAAGLLFLARHRHGYHGMRHFFRRLDTSPGQEKVMRNAWSQMREAGKQMRDRAKATRPELSRLIRGEQLSQAELSAFIQTRLSEISEGSPALVDALSQVHEVLDDRQRSLLADLVEQGRGPWQFGRP